MSKPPKVHLHPNESLQNMYHEGNGDRYLVAGLIDAAKDLHVFDLPLCSIDLTQCIWTTCNMRELAEHVKRCMEADLDCPILLDWNGAIADGRHRVIRAMVEGKRYIKAKRFMHKLPPDRCDGDAH